MISSSEKSVLLSIVKAVVLFVLFNVGLFIEIVLIWILGPTVLQGLGDRMRPVAVAQVHLFAHEAIGPIAKYMDEQALRFEKMLNRAEKLLGPRRRLIGDAEPEEK